jgi:hypothetical protein
LKFRRGSSLAKVAIARQLAVMLYWMLRQQKDYAQLVRMQGSPASGVVDSVPSTKLIGRLASLQRVGSSN